MVSMVSKKTKPKIVWHYGTLSAISGIFFLYISYEGLLWKRGTMCHSAMRGIYSIREPGPDTREVEHVAITSRHTFRL
jgi:hypothetical protein